MDKKVCECMFMIEVFTGYLLLVQCKHCQKRYEVDLPTAIKAGAQTTITGFVKEVPAE